MIMIKKTANHCTSEAVNEREKSVCSFREQEDKLFDDYNSERIDLYEKNDFYFSYLYCELSELRHWQK